MHACMYILLAASSACTVSGKIRVPEEDAANTARYSRAEALFKERCKTAGVLIKRTIPDVEGIELTKIRQAIAWGGAEYFDPLYSEAAMVGEHRGDYYLKQFLMSEVRVAARPAERGALMPPTAPLPGGILAPKSGYRFIEYLDSQNHRRYRCTLSIQSGQHSWEGTPLHCQVVTEPTARYALDYEDIFNPQDRDVWIAGTRLKVVDNQTGETIAQLTKFVWDPAFGDGATGRRPWEHAGSAASTVCPSDSSQRRGFDSRYFVDTVLLPKRVIDNTGELNK